MLVVFANFIRYFASWNTNNTSFTWQIFVHFILNAITTYAVSINPLKDHRCVDAAFSFQLYQSICAVNFCFVTSRLRKELPKTRLIVFSRSPLCDIYEIPRNWWNYKRVISWQYNVSCFFPQNNLHSVTWISSTRRQRNQLLHCRCHLWINAEKRVGNRSPVYIRNLWTINLLTFQLDACGNRGWVKDRRLRSCTIHVNRCSIIRKTGGRSLPSPSMLRNDVH